MKMTTLALSLLAGLGTGCTTVPPTLLVSELPNCFDANYDRERDLFTIMNDAGKAVNQQCLLTVGPRGDVASASRLAAGTYTVFLSSGGGGGAGGSLQGLTGGGGGGGGGAGAAEVRAAVTLTEGVYKVTIGAGGPGGSACMPGVGFGGGPGWVGSPSNMIRVATGEVVIGTLGADTYARLTRAQSDRTVGERLGQGGSGPGQTTGGRGGSAETASKAEVEAGAGASVLASGSLGAGGAAGPTGPAHDDRTGTGGGGGATSRGAGGGGGGESLGDRDVTPVKGTLGSGGGGGEGTRSECDPGARGGHGYIALRPI